MSLFSAVATSEVRNLMREKMTALMLAYPVLLGALGRYLIEAELAQGQLMGVISAVFAIVTGFAYGAAAGFSLLDDRDDQVLISVQISPVSVKLYIWLKVGLLYLLAVAGTFLAVRLMGAIELATGELLVLSLVASLQAPALAFAINSLARNKVEGFVAMKGAGLLLLLPMGGFFFLDAKEWLFAVAPGHWATKAVQWALLRPQIEAGLLRMNLSFYGYLGVGLGYNLLLTAAAYRVFVRRNGL